MKDYAAKNNVLRKYQTVSGQANSKKYYYNDPNINVFEFLAIVGVISVFFYGFAFYGTTFLKALTY